jgi:hypothetical protein
VASEAVPSNQLSNYNRFLKRAQLVGPHTENANVALKLNKLRGVISMSIGAGALTAGHSLPVSAMIGGSVLLGSKGMKEFSERVLLNPRMARISTQLLDVDPKSKVAINGTRAILAALKGSQVAFMAPDGTQHKAEITKDGRVKVVGKADEIE